MKVLVFVLNKVEKLNPLLEKFNDEGISGATILNSNGMAHSLYESDDHHAFASFRQFLDPKRAESKTIFMVINDGEEEKIVNMIEEVVGSIDNPDTGIVFSVDTNFVRGKKR